MSETISDEELIRAAIASAWRDLHVCMPGKVKSYDKETQKAEVIPQLKRSIPKRGGFVLEDLPVLVNVPVIFPEGGGYFTAFPLQPGDPVTLFFADRSIGAWLERGDVCDPGDQRGHGLSGAYAYPGGHPDARKLQSASDANMVLGRDGVANAQIEITPTEVHLGAGATKEVTRKGDPVNLGTWQVTKTTILGTPVITAISCGGTTILEAGTALDNKGTVNGGSGHIKAVD